MTGAHSFPEYEAERTRRRLRDGLNYEIHLEKLLFWQMLFFFVTISVMSFVDVTDFMQSGKRRDGCPFHGRHAHTTPGIPIRSGHRSLIAITLKNQIKIQISRAYNNNNNRNKNKKPEYKVVGVPENEAGLRKTGLELLQAVGGGGRGRDCWYGGWRHIESLDGP